MAATPETIDTGNYRTMATALQGIVWILVFATLYTNNDIDILREPPFLFASITFGIATLLVVPFIARRKTDTLLEEPQRITRFLIALMSGFILAVFLFANRAFTTDDGYIALQYAKTLVRDGQLQFNLGDAANALTGILWPVVLAPAFFTRDPVASARLISEMFSLSVVVLPCLVLRRTWQCLFYGLLTASYYPLVIWTLGGLETPLAALLLLLVAMFEYRTSSRRIGGGFLVLAGAIYTVRPDALLVPVGMVLADMLACNGLRDRIASLLRGSAWLAVFPSVTLLFNAFYYGSPLPSALWIKGPTNHYWGLHSLVYGVHYLTEFLTLGFLILPLVFLWIWARVASAPLLSRSGKRILLGVALYASWIVLLGDVHMMFTYRAYVPVIPMLVYLLTMEIDRVRSSTGDLFREPVRWPSLSAIIPRSGPIASFLVVFAMFSIPNAGLMSAHGFDRGMAFERRGTRTTGGDFPMKFFLYYTNAFKDCGHYLANVAKKSDRLYSQVIATIPYYAGLYSIDDQLVRTYTSRYMDIRDPGGGMIRKFDWAVTIEGGGKFKTPFNEDIPFMLVHTCSGGAPSALVSVYRRLPFISGQVAIHNGAVVHALYFPTAEDVVLRIGSSVVTASGRASSSPVSSLSPGDIIILGESGDLLKVRSAGEFLRLVGTEGQKIRVSNVGMWDAKRKQFGGLEAELRAGHWVIDVGAMQAVNPNSRFKEGSDTDPIPSFWISPGGGGYTISRMRDTSGPFVRVRATRATPYLVVNGQQPLAKLNGVPVSLRGRIRAHSRGQVRLTLYDVVNADGVAKTYLVQRSANEEWTALIVRAAMVFFPDPRDNFSLGVFDVQNGDWFDICELDMFVGVLP